MKRTLVLLGTLTFCGLLSGCAGDPRDSAIDSVVQLMRAASGDVEGIKKEVNKAIEKQKKDNRPLDLSEAIKSTKNLEQTGKNLQELKARRVDTIKPADEDEKAELASRKRTLINGAFADLVKAKMDLNEALQQAAAINDDAREKVDELRSKIREAEAPFESIARQQG
jgi:hypothetical protein